jgi:hypothetical protein
MLAKAVDVANMKFKVVDRIPDSNVVLNLATPQTLAEVIKLAPTAAKPRPINVLAFIAGELADTSLPYAEKTIAIADNTAVISLSVSPPRNTGANAVANPPAVPNPHEWPRNKWLLFTKVRPYVFSDRGKVVLYYNIGVSTHEEAPMPLPATTPGEWTLADLVKMSTSAADNFVLETNVITDLSVTQVDPVVHAANADFVNWKNCSQFQGVGRLLSVYYRCRQFHLGDKSYHRPQCPPQISDAG